MPAYILWIYIVIQLILMFCLLRIISRLGLLIIFHKQTLPYVPAPTKAIKAIIASGALINKPVIVDLGSGSGTLIASLAKQYPQAYFIGIEKQYWLACIARLRFIFKQKQISIKQGNFFDYSVKSADAIVGFWISDITKKLLPKFEQECKPNCTIISIIFSLPISSKFSSKNIPYHRREKIYIYQKNANTE